MNKTMNPVLVMIALLGITSCSSDSSSPPAAPIGNINGTWNVSEVSTSATAGCSKVYNYDITVSQNDNTATVTDAGGNVFKGNINGNRLTWSGSFPEAPGTTTANVTATISANCSSFEATSTWSYSETGFSCNGTSKASGSRTSGGSSC